MCEKKRYKTKESAISWMFKYRMHDPSREEKGVYYCTECKSWHLTRQMNAQTPLLFKFSITTKPNRKAKNKYSRFSQKF